MNGAARGFGDYDVLADAAYIAWRAEQRHAWMRSRSLMDRLLDGLAASVVWCAAGALVLLAVATGLGAAWLVVTLVHVLWG